MKRLQWAAFVVTLVCGLAMTARATVLVNDQWSDGTRTDPSATGTPAYSEQGTDSDSDGNLESAWFGSSSSLSNPAAGTLRASPSSSAFETTYFTQPSSQVVLGNSGDSLKVTWVFSPSGTAFNGSAQALPIALAYTPSGARITGDASPATTVSYAGYAMYLNMSQTLMNGSPFQLKEWAIGTNTGGLLGSASNWGVNGTSGGGLANGATSGNHGFDLTGTTYTYIMTLTRNGASGMDIAASITGGTYNTSGTGSVSVFDASANTYTYDTFAMRYSSSGSTAPQIDTTLFRVEFNPIPEPSTLVLAGLGLGLMMAVIRRRS